VQYQSNDIYLIYLRYVRENFYTAYYVDVPLLFVQRSLRSFGLVGAIISLINVTLIFRLANFWQVVLWLMLPDDHYKHALGEEDHLHLF
jgi:hypothetical protein